MRKPSAPSLLRLFLAACLGVVLGSWKLRADTPWTMAVEMAAEVDEVTPKITLHWKADPNDRIYSSNYFPTYTVYRRQLEENFWTKLGPGDGENHVYEDRAVSVGIPYEYKVVKNFDHGIKYDGYGYLRSGLGIPAIESRGTVLLMVDATVFDAIADRVGVLQADLLGDGWKVRLVPDLGRNDAPEAVRARIQAEARNDPSVNTVLLLGHFPIVRAGRSNPDGHAARPMPADAFYGDLDGNWGIQNRDGVYLTTRTQLPSSVELAVGRVDFADMPDTLAILRTTEAELLRGYLAKNHAYRQAATRSVHRALTVEGGDAGGQAPVVTGYRNFGGLVGIEPGSVAKVGAGYRLDPGLRWISRLSQDDYLWTYGEGAGFGSPYSGLNGLGTYGDTGVLTYFDLYGERPKATFYLLFGSWVCDWSSNDNLLRAALIGGDGLAATWAGRPYLYFHGMGMGETIGEALRLSQNNDGIFYQTPSPSYARGFHIALMGDPTLRQDFVAPPTAAVVFPDGNGVVVQWKASNDRDVLGYYIYRSTTPDGPFIERLGDLVTGTAGVNAGSLPGPAYYMVRAVKRETTASGSYYNLSEGAFPTPLMSPQPSPPSVPAEPREIE